MRRVYTLAISLIFTLFIMAAPITPRQALQKAKSFAGAHHHNTNIRLKQAYTSVKSGEEANYYIYNIGQDEGFVVVSGNDQADMILGYTDQGRFDYDQMPENMKAWLSSYDSEVSVIRRHSTMPLKVSQAHPADVIQPLISTTWAQTYPYNIKCPVVDGVNCKTGCTATALAQVLRYHQYPTGKTTKIPSYTTSTLRIQMPELASTTFDWSKMPDILTEDSPQAEKDEVAKLMLYCGQATDMNYTPSGSGAYTYKIPDRLPLYFGYPKTMHYLYRESYDEAEWDSLLVRELLNNRPVIYTAYTNLGQGHTFICDGYDGNGLYHINWGWNGVGNGYFRISVLHATDEGLNEEIKNYHLSMRQTILVGLKPAGEDEYVAPVEYYRAYSRPSLKNGRTYTRPSSDSDFSDITFKQSFANTSSSTRKLSHGVGLYDEAGMLVSVLSSSTANLTVGNSKNYEAANLSFGSKIQDGHYALKAIYKRSSTGSWTPMSGTDKNYIQVEIHDTVMTLIPVPKADFQVNSLRKDDAYLSIDMANPDEAFFGPIYLRKEDPTTHNIIQVSNDQLSFDASSSTTYQLYIDDDVDFDLQNDQFYLSVDEYDTQYFYSSLNETEGNLEKHIEILNQNEETGEVIGDRIICRLLVQNTGTEAYADQIMMTLKDEEGDVVSNEKTLLELGAGEETVLNYEIPLSDFTKRYVLTATHLKNTYTWEESSTDVLTVAKGGIYWTKDGSMKTQKAATKFVVPEEALAINLHNAYTSNVTPNSNPNTIYMLNSTVPRGLVGKNNVNNSNRGDKLTLTDGYDYFIPTELTFSGTITYQRTFTSEDSLQLSVLSLPFAPSEVKMDGEEVSWKKSADDETGHFWLMSFEGIVDTLSTVVTSYAPTIEAQTPYLLVADSLLIGKTVIFTASKQTLHPTLEYPQVVSKDSCVLTGTHCQQHVANSYTLSDGHFVYSEEGEETAPFRAYLLADERISSKDLTVDFYESIAPGHIQPEIMKGDVNEDGLVDITDVLLTVDYILGNTPEHFVIANADAKVDNIIDISDVLLMVDIILGKAGEDGENE